MGDVLVLHHAENDVRTTTHFGGFLADGLHGVGETCKVVSHVADDARTLAQQLPTTHNAGVCHHIFDCTYNLVLLDVKYKFQHFDGLHEGGDVFALIFPVKRVMYAVVYDFSF